MVEEEVPQLPLIAMVPASATFMVTSGLPSLPGVDTAVVSVAAETDTSYSKDSLVSWSAAFPIASETSTDIV